MSILTTSKQNPWPLHRFTVDEYHRMIQSGILTENHDVELLEGWICQKLGPNPPHDCSLGKTTRVLNRVLPPQWIVRGQSAITTADSEPEPDIAVVPGPDDVYSTRHPLPTEIGMLVEISDSSLSYDRDVKGPVYAGANIGYYWIINLVDRQIEVYTDPTGPASAPQYRKRQDFRGSDVVPLILAGQQVAAIPVNDLLPPP